MTRARALPGGVRRGLGWDIASPYAAGMDATFGPHAYGHTGYMGTSLWIVGGYDDRPVRRRSVVITRGAATKQ